MATRVLHVFSPNYKRRFSGDVVRWRYLFSHWNAPDVNHLVLDCGKNQVVGTKEAFSFGYPAAQAGTSRWERAIWVFSLLQSLAKHHGQYDILHVHVLWWGGLLVGPWAKARGIPAVYESVLLGADTPSGVREERLGRLKVRCLKDYRAILAISDCLAEDYLKHGFSAEQVHTLTLCVDTELFAPIGSVQEKAALRRKLDLPENATILVFVGSVIERKGVDVLLRAFAQAAAARTDLHLLIVGPKDRNENPSLDEDFVNRLRALLRKDNLSERVSFTGIVQDRRRVAEMYRAADVFVFPSNREGLPNVVLEAMASGLPVVVSHLPGLENVIRHQENGFLVPIGNASALSDAILMVSSDRALADRLGRNARDHVEKNHGFAAWQARLVEFYRGLLS